MENGSEEVDESGGNIVIESPVVEKLAEKSETDKTLEEYYKELREEQYAKYGTPTKPAHQDLHVSELGEQKAPKSALESLRDGLLINSPDNIITQSRCELLETRISQQCSELQTARKRIADLEYKNSTDVSIEKYNELESRFLYQIKAKDNELQRLKDIIQVQSNDMTALKAGCLISAADCEKQVLDARYEHQNCIIARVTSDPNDLKIRELKSKYADLLRRHETMLEELGEMTELVDALRQETTALKLENLDLKKENLMIKSRGGPESE